MKHTPHNRAGWKLSPGGLVSMTYWSPSAGNLLASIAVSMGADMRVWADATEVLRVVSQSSIDDLARLLGGTQIGFNRHLDAEHFARLRAGAVAIAVRCIDALSAPEKHGTVMTERRVAERRIQMKNIDAAKEGRHIVDRRVRVHQRHSKALMTSRPQ